ncbi:MAG: hydrogenase maturation protease [Acidobacteria bacterium]|nr:MAG: hydrogenase maturation protease [Acidobacteriota bacterium]
MPRVLLIGYGNTLCGDDALGPVAIERLSKMVADAEFIACHQLSPELAERVAICDLAVFVDATCQGEPGTVRVEQLVPVAVVGSAIFTHYVNPSTVLELAKTLYGRAPQAMLVTGAGAKFHNSEGLSEKGREALDEICRIVPQLVRDFVLTT